MKRCPFCEGKGVTGQIMHGEDGETVTIMGQKIPVATWRDRLCGMCQGMKEITDEEHARVTMPRVEFLRLFPEAAP